MTPTIGRATPLKLSRVSAENAPAPMTGGSKRSATHPHGARTVACACAARGAASVRTVAAAAHAAIKLLKGLAPDSISAGCCIQGPTEP